MSAEYCYAECHFQQGIELIIVMLIVIILSSVLLSAEYYYAECHFRLIAKIHNDMLTVVILSDVLPNSVAPIFNALYCFNYSPSLYSSIS
jgi:hypothetical protein